MTREEAINVLKKDLQIIDDPNVTMTAREWEEHDDNMRDALEMAIEALSENKRTIKHTETHACDYISRQAAVDALRNYLVGKNVPCDGTLTCRLIENEVINKLPSAEPKRGRWIGKYPVTSVCSECGFLIHDSKVKVFAFCPNCGAKMRGEQE